MQRDSGPNGNKPPPRQVVGQAAGRAKPYSPAYGGGRRPLAAKTVGSFVPRLTRPAFEKFGFSAATLITDWATIVGSDIARYARPERLKWPKRVSYQPDGVDDAERGRPGATLMLAVEAGRALDAQYKAALIVERINAYFGYRAVSDVRIVQVASLESNVGDDGGQRVVPRAPVPSAATTPPVVASVTDADLRAALERMAAGLVSRKAQALAPRQD
ncbi:MAG: DciA family protein [Hyphomicrobiaceae bacterium]